MAILAFGMLHSHKGDILQGHNIADASLTIVGMVFFTYFGFRVGIQVYKGHAPSIH